MTRAEILLSLEVKKTHTEYSLNRKAFLAELAPNEEGY